MVLQSLFATAHGQVEPERGVSATCRRATAADMTRVRARLGASRAGADVGVLLTLVHPFTIAPVHRFVLALEGLPFHRKGAPFEPGHPSRTRLLPALATRIVMIAQIHVPGLSVQGAPTARRPPHRFSIASPLRSLALAPIHELALRVQGAPTA
jgi:hypothetical protein